MRTLALVLTAAAFVGATFPPLALADILPPPPTKKTSLKADSSPSPDITAYNAMLKAAQHSATVKKKRKGQKLQKTKPLGRPPAQNKSS